MSHPNIVHIYNYKFYLHYNYKFHNVSLISGERDKINIKKKALLSQHRGTARWLTFCSRCRD